MDLFVNMSQFSESEVKLRSNQMYIQYCGFKFKNSFFLISKCEKKY